VQESLVPARDPATRRHHPRVVRVAGAVFRWTAQADPQRHLYAAQLLGADIRGASHEDAGEVLAQAIIKIMKDTGMPNGLRAVGFVEEDIPQLVEGTLAQQRLTKLAPLEATKAVFEQLFSDAMTYW
jgi:alcohol dehydrogenase class IV